MSEKFKERLGKLQSELKSCVASSGTSCVPTLLVIGSVVPVVVWFAFYFIKPSFITYTDSSGEDVICPKKISLWVIGVTIVLWAGLYALTWSETFNMGLACIFS